ncbi:MAG: trypsin-like peptidase domain-containing protein [Clostridia bacterium]|nr:trypsin-like peptidase domain-containing protein [Clostridia bacterium]
MKTKLLSFLLLLCLLAFSSCTTETLIGITEAKINKDGELIVTYGDGTEQNLGVVVGENGKDGAAGNDGADGATVITGDGDSISVAASKGLRSAVSIVCNFKATVQQGGWRPGYGSTTTKEYSSAGSGVIYRLDKEAGDAFIITNYHVVYDAGSNTENGISDDISVYLYGSATEENAIRATYVGGSLYYDIAVLYVEDSELLRASDACEIRIADSDKIAVGEHAIAIGNAQGYGISVSAGIVSVDSEYITMTAADGRTEVSFRVMRVDTAVNSGNSGGGMFDGKGNLIGIVNAKIVDDGVENIGYAIPSNVAIAIAENIIHYCHGTDVERVQRALLGITVNATDSKAVYDGETGCVTICETVSVYEVGEGTLAHGVLQKGDVILSATLRGESIEVTRQYHIIDMMLDVRAGDVVTLSLLRDDEPLTVEITITEECLTEY